MPGLEGDLEEWQTQEVTVTRGEAEGDIDLEGLPFLKVTRGPRHYLQVLQIPFQVVVTCEASSPRHVHVPLASCDM